jgi:Fe/S biogenesis protein NfuA
MLSFTDMAKQKVAEFLAQNSQDIVGLRLSAFKQGRRRFRYDFSMMQETDIEGEDQVIDLGDFKVFVDPQSSEWLDGTSVDYVSDATGTGFKIDNPQAVATWDDPIAKKAQKVIDEQILPAVGGHGGWVELIDVKDDTAYIEFGGGCQGCGMSSQTLKQGIETAITGAVEEIKQVVDQTDHTAGQNPYCQG